MERPGLTKDLSADLFLQFYYLKEELVSFCKMSGLSAQGGKPEITDRIAHFLKTGEKKARTMVRKSTNFSIPAFETILESGRRYDEARRRFFETQLGPAFYFNVKFQKWLT